MLQDASCSTLHLADTRSERATLKAHSLAPRLNRAGKGLPKA